MSVPASTDSAAHARRDSVANMKLEVLAVSDVDRAKGFYDARYMIAEQVGQGLPS
jgi:hypothetical protein